MTDFSKGLSDILPLVEGEVKDVELAKTDAQAVSESLAKEWDAKLAPSESVPIVEQIANMIGATVSDAISFAESVSKIAVVLGLTDNQTFAEEVAKNATLGKTDTLSIAEAVAKALGLLKTDSIEFAEAKAMAVVKVLADSVAFADTSQVFDVTQEVWWGMVKWRTACHSGL